MAPSQHIAIRAVSDVPEMQSASLRGFERIAVPFCTWLNTAGMPKRLIQVFVKHFSRRWVAFVTRPRWQLFNFERVRDLDPECSVILVSNHRSFFDMYVSCAVLYQETKVLDRLYFPVRSNFFYTNPIGFLVNLGVSGCAMWPPVFKDRRRGELNPVGTEQMVHVLQYQGNAIGIHPEGTRGKSDDPFDLGPPRPGVGKLVRGSPDNTLVIPFFIQGLTNDFISEVKGRFFGGRPPIHITWGEPIPVAELREHDKAQSVAEHLHGVIRDLAEEDRARCE